MTTTRTPTASKTRAPRGSARAALIAAAHATVRKQGYAATSVDEICAAAGVTKGAFFHHFRSKEDLGVAAAAHFSDWLEALFVRSGWRHQADPLDRVLAYIDFRKSLVTGGVPDFTCLVGTMVQETYETVPDIRDACDRSISGHAATLVADIEAAMAGRGMVATGWTAQSLALHTQAVLQGAFILAKARGGAEVAKGSVDHLRRYIELLFGRAPTA